MKRFWFAASVVVLYSCIFLSSCLPDSPDLPSFEEQLEKDIAAIDAYLAANNIVAQQHSSGLRFVVHREDSGDQPDANTSCVVVNYEGRFLSTNAKFDAASNLTFPLVGVIDGWRIGMPLLHEGDSATLYIPSGLAYGYYGYPPTIPSNANLVFDVGLTQVKPFNANTGRCD